MTNCSAGYPGTMTESACLSACVQHTLHYCSDFQRGNPWIYIFCDTWNSSKLSFMLYAFQVFYEFMLLNRTTLLVKRYSPYSITERTVPQLIPVLGSQPAGDVSHKPGGRLPLLSARPAVTPATLKRAATNFAAWWTDARGVWTVCLRLLPDSVAAAIWIRALLRLSPAR